jgi:hypothetical protein
MPQKKYKRRPPRSPEILQYRLQMLPSAPPWNQHAPGLIFKLEQRPNLFDPNLVGMIRNTYLKQIEDVKTALTYHLWNYDFQDESQIRIIHPEFLELDYPEIYHGLNTLRAIGMTEQEIKDWLIETINMTSQNPKLFN